MGAFQDLTGKRFGRLVVTSYVGNRKWLCKCDCGNVNIVNAQNLKRGWIKSCGCWRIEKRQNSKIKREKLSCLSKDDVILKCLEKGVIKVNSDTGEIFSCRNSDGRNLRELKKLKGSNLNGYIVHTIGYCGRRVQVKEHRIVWMSVNGRIPDGYVIDHINSIKTDNRISNLQLLTNAENVKKAWKDGRCSKPYEEVNEKLSQKQRDEIVIEYLKGNKSYAEIANEYGVSRSHVHICVKKGTEKLAQEKAQQFYPFYKIIMEELQKEEDHAESLP